VLLFENWIRQRGGFGAHDIDTCVRAVRNFIQTNPTRFEDLTHHNNNLAIRERAGFREKDLKTGTVVHYLFPAIFESEICKAHDYRAIAKQLIVRGHLKQHQGSANFTIQKRIPGMGKPRLSAIAPSIFEDEESIK
jgi:uncharacterized protein (DUF927 family)